MVTVRVTRLVRTGLTVALLGAGCASSETLDVERVAVLFADPEGDPASRCDLLAPATETALQLEEGVPCPVALAELPIGTGAVRSVAVWDREAQVLLTDDTFFLTRTQQGWRVTAAACRASESDRPYVCQLEGP